MATDNRRQTMIMRGDMGPEVAEARQLLWNALSGDVKSRDDACEFDSMMEAMTMVFQDQSSLLVDGIIGDKTMASLKSTSASKWGTTPRFENLPAPYLSQRDNVNNPSGSCNVTSLAMLLLAEGATPLNSEEQFEDELWERLQQKDAKEYYQDTFPEMAANQNININTVHGMLDWLAKQYGVGLVFKFSTTEHIVRSILGGHPVMVSGKFTGSGHIVLLTGFFEAEEIGYPAYIVNDPWGNWMQGYRNRNGEQVVYPPSVREILRTSFPPGQVGGFWTHMVEE